MRARKIRIRRASAGKATLAALTVVASTVAAFPAVPAQAAPGPRFGEGYRLVSNTTGRVRDVPGLAVNPADQNHIVEADVDPFNGECGYHVSFDGGRTWRGGRLTVRQGAESPAFPTPACLQNFDSGGYAHMYAGIVFGSGQNVYVAFSSHRGSFNRPESNFDGGDGDDAVVARSTDGGRTFQPATVAVPGGGPTSANPGLAGVGLRPQLAVQRGAVGGQDRLYAAVWHCYIKIRASASARGGCSGGGGDRRILVARSDNGGTTWGAPVLASAANVRAGGPCAPACTTGTAAAEAGSADEQAREPSQPVIGPDGAVYVAYRSRDITDGTTCPVNPSITTPAPGGFSRNKAECVVVTKSVNQGQTWAQASTNQPVLGGTLTNPRLAIDPSTGGAGTLYVVYQRPPVSTADTDISLQKSTDGGANWTPPVRVNDDVGTAPQTNPWVSVGPGGIVHVIWGDRRHPYPDAGSYGDIYHASSTNGGASFAPNRRVTDRTINLQVGRYGDLGSGLTPGGSWYGPVSLPLADGRVLAAWADSREGNFDTGFQDVYLARLDSATPGVGRQTIATATPGGLSVVLSRLAYPGGNEARGGNGGDPVSRVVVANQDDLPSALAGAVLARSNAAPLLLSPAAALQPIVRAESARIKPEGAYLIGDTSALSPAVSDAVRATTRDGENVDRLAAPPTVATANRPADVARQVAELMRPLPGASPEAVIVNPKTPEAAAAAALAAGLKLPILFVDERPTIPPPTTAAITSLGVRRLLIVGGTGSVNAAVATALETAVGGAANVKRVSGTNPSDTSEAVLAEARLRGMPANVVYVADGARPVEGAALGAAVARLNGLMLFTAGASASAAEARIGALGGGLDAAVDRIVAAIGTGGTDPALPGAATAPTQTAPAAGGAPPPANLSIAGCPARAARTVVVMTNGNDIRNGTANLDLIFAGGGDDVVDGLAGDDCLDLGPGADRGQGGAGGDFVQGGLGNDVAGGGAGSDRLRGFTGNDRLGGDAGGDTLLGDSGNDVISGGSGNDRITGGSGRDRITGGAGADTIAASDGARDRINCGAGRDAVTADSIDRVARNCERVRRR